MMKAVKLTEKQKLQVLADRFYLQDFCNNAWKPKKGDYYTSVRNDLELYYIIDEDEECFYTIYCDTSKYGDNLVNPAKWLKTEFLVGFGVNRVEVKDYIFNL